VRQSWPKTSGTIELANLRDEVTIHRDEYGIPHIYANSTHDLFMAQGFVHAQDRFWQMDFWRHIGSGRLAELFGESEVSRDRFLRTLGWERIAEQELETLDPDDRAALEAYAQGVNAYLDDRSKHDISLEYTALMFTNPGYQPADWQPLHTLTWPKVMAWDLDKHKLDLELERSHLLKTLSREQVAELFPPYPEDHPVIISEKLAENGTWRRKTERSKSLSQAWAPMCIHLPSPPQSSSPKNGRGGGKKSFSGSPAPILGVGVGGRGEARDCKPFPYDTPSLETLQHPAIAQALQSVEQNLSSLDNLFPSIGRSMGSNSWVVSGDLTSTGQPLLANDPHLGAEIPSIWYEVGLHCQPQGPDCPYDVTGVSFAGVPGVIIGHSDRIAWGLTHVLADGLDLVIERVNPNNPNQYEVNGEWVEMEPVQETIQVAGNEPVQQTVRYTRHGPIISETYEPLNEFEQKAGVELPEEYAIALRWTALEPSTLFSSILAINRADNWQEFRQGAAEFDIVPHNLVYADADGNIGYQMPGDIPIRDQGQGRFPVPGWQEDYASDGYIPFEQLPSAFNPAEGYLVTANNPPLRNGYPYLISYDWSYGFRAERIHQLIQQAEEPLTLEDMQRIQRDSQTPLGEFLLPELLRLSFAESRLQRAQHILQNWDQQYRQDQAAPALLAMVWKQLLANTFHDELPEDYWPEGNDRWMEVMRQQLQQPQSAWWDDQSTEAVERQDDILRQSFEDAVTTLQNRFGTDSRWWRWGELHGVPFTHQSLGKSGIPPVEMLFNRGPVPVSGGRGMINANVWDASKSFAVNSIPSLRMVVDFGNLGDSEIIHATGQSGHAFHPHYTDQMELWQRMAYHPMGRKAGEVAVQAEATLILVPRQ